MNRLFMKRGYSNENIDLKQNNYSVKASQVEKAKELRDAGHAFRQIALEVLGDAKKQSTIANWLAK